MIATAALALASFAMGGSAGASPRLSVVHERLHGVATDVSHLSVGGQENEPAKRLARLEGSRMRLGGETLKAVESTNWSGMAGTGTGIEGAEGSWRVPSIQASSSALYSASWVGVDGASSSDPNLIQVGTEQDTSDGYYAWIQIWEDSELTTSGEVTNSGGAPATVDPGDTIDADVVEASAGLWTIEIEDVTQDWYFEQNFSYDGPGESAEWVEEAPSSESGQQLGLADFDTVDFSETGIYGDFSTSGTSWYSTDLSAANEVDMYNETGEIIAAPSAPSAASSSGQSFTDSYVSAPGAPTDVTGAAGLTSVDLSWRAPAHDGGISVTGYSIEEYLAGSLLATLSATATSDTLTGLTTGDSYSFAVAAENAGGWTSTYTSPVTVMPIAPPRLTVTSPLQAYQLAKTVDVRYSGTDATSPVVAYDVRYQVKSWHASALSGYVDPASWQRTTATSLQLTGVPGDEYCFEVQVLMESGDVSSWSPSYCTTLPLASSSLKAITAGWKHHTGASYYLHSYVETATEGAELRLANAEASQLALVVTKCPACGALAVYVNGHNLKTVSTYARTTKHGSVVVLPKFTEKRATILIRAVRAGKDVIVEGLAVT